MHRLWSRFCFSCQQMLFLHRWIALVEESLQAGAHGKCMARMSAIASQLHFAKGWSLWTMHTHSHDKPLRLWSQGNSMCSLSDGFLRPQHTVDWNPSHPLNKCGANFYILWDALDVLLIMKQWTLLLKKKKKQTDDLLMCFLNLSRWLLGSWR